MPCVVPPYTINEPISVAGFREITAKRMSEKELLQNVLDCARTFGYRVYHTFNSKRSEAGFPDVIAVGHTRLIAIECKREREDLTPAQTAWLDDLAFVPGVECYVIRPSDWLSGQVERILRVDQ